MSIFLELQYSGLNFFYSPSSYFTRKFPSLKLPLLLCAFHREKLAFWKEKRVKIIKYNNLMKILCSKFNGICS